jgi:uncharacterized protein
MTPEIVKGYAVVRREWRAGDTIELELPMVPQRVIADSRIKADTGDVALRYGPLVYNVETADQHLDQPLGRAPLQAVWRPDLLGGVMAIAGKWADGTPMTAIPNYARMNRVDSSHSGFMEGEPGVNYAPGSTTAGSSQPLGASAADGPKPSTRRKEKVDSKVWMNSLV